MILRFLLAVILSLSPLNYLYAFQGVALWGGKNTYTTKALGGAWLSYSYSFAVSSDGSTYVGGTYNNNTSNGYSMTDFGGSTIFGLASSNSTDGYIAKLNPNGSQAWVQRIGGNVNIDIVDDIAVDASGNVYLTGRYHNSSANVNAVKSFSGAALLGKTSTDSSDIFVAKLNSSGTQLWIATLGGTGSDSAGAIAVDSSGNVYVAGAYYNTNANANAVKTFAGANLFGKSATAGNDVFIAKLNSTGTQQWITSMGGLNTDYVHDIEVDSSGNVYAVGQYVNNTANANATKDFANANLVGESTTAGSDGFIAKLNTSGTQQWIITFGGTGSDGLYEIELDSSTNIFVSGIYENSLANIRSVTGLDGSTINGVTSTDSNDVLVVKLDSTGAQQWIKTMGGTSDFENVNALSLDSSGNLYLTGIYYNTSSNSNSVVDFLGATILGIPATLFGYDIFATKLLNSDGTQQWIKTMGGVRDDGPAGIGVDSAGTIYVAGTISNASNNPQSVLDFMGYVVKGKSGTTYQTAFVTRFTVP